MDKPISITELIEKQSKETKKRALFGMVKGLDDACRLFFPEAKPFDEAKVKQEISDIVEGK